MAVVIVTVLAFIAVHGAFLMAKNLVYAILAIRYTLTMTQALRIVTPPNLEQTIKEYERCLLPFNHGVHQMGCGYVAMLPYLVMGNHRVGLILVMISVVSFFGLYLWWRHLDRIFYNSMRQTK